MQDRSARRALLPIVTVRPNRLRAAVAPSATSDRRLDDRALAIEPPFAALDLIGVRALVQAPLAAHLELEVLDSIGDEDVVARNAGVRQRLIEHAAGRADERLAGEIFLVARLFARPA